jgi:nitroimidazol reductase NimA-like FMN-containing flavoprotein (pyridoxamine 5'-phosphate oxidase superfamily)
MTDMDEPILNESGEDQQGATQHTASEERIRRLATGQLYGVLCTQTDKQPYGSMVAFASSDDLARFVFATPRATRKYRILTECRNVALVVNNARESPHDMMQIEAFTATGKAREVTTASHDAMWARLLKARHAQLTEFIAAPSTALFVVEVVRYFLVHSFQEVRQWVPPRDAT